MRLTTRIGARGQHHLPGLWDGERSIRSAPISLSTYAIGPLWLRSIGSKGRPDAELEALSGKPRGNAVIAGLLGASTMCLALSGRDQERSVTPGTAAEEDVSESERWLKQRHAGCFVLGGSASDTCPRIIAWSSWERRDGGPRYAMHETRLCAPRRKRRLFSFLTATNGDVPSDATMLSASAQP
jgi:hypothetical protein